MGQQDDGCYEKYGYHNHNNDNNTDGVEDGGKGERDLYRNYNTNIIVDEEDAEEDDRHEYGYGEDEEEILPTTRYSPRNEFSSEAFSPQRMPRRSSMKCSTITTAVANVAVVSPCGDDDDDGGGGGGENIGINGNRS